MLTAIAKRFAGWVLGTARDNAPEQANTVQPQPPGAAALTPPISPDSPISTIESATAVAASPDIAAAIPDASATVAGATDIEAAGPQSDAIPARRPPELVPAPLAAKPEPAPICLAVQAHGAPLPTDPALEQLRARLAAMESRVLEFDERKAEMDQLLAEFARCQYQALGELVGEHLALRLEALRLRAEHSAKGEDQAAADAARDEWTAYQRTLESPVEAPPALADEERAELKALYRATAMRCHPDRVDTADKAFAHEMFLRTQDAYRRGDLDAMRQILRELSGATAAVAADERTSSLTELERTLQSLEDKAVKLMMAIQTMQISPAYRQARQRSQWDGYFAAVREQIEGECELLRREIAGVIA